jgi:hypothetical protein
MKGDFSRFSFRPDRHYAGVFLQQGRPQLDSDWNEQTAITSAALRAMARDIFGPHGGAGDGFAISPLRDAAGRLVPRDFMVREGSYYVEGIRCENGAPLAYGVSTDRMRCGEDSLDEHGSSVVYLEVWEQGMTAIQDPDLLEPALSGVDTSTRLQVAWRVRLLHLGDGSAVERDRGAAERILAQSFPPGSSGMRARVDQGGYRGLENRLYRVEIHSGSGQGQATFVWSGHNGSVVAPVSSVDDGHVVIEVDPTDPHGRRFDVGCWVQPEDDVSTRCGQIAPLLRIEGQEDGGRLVVAPAWPLESPDPSNHPLIRRWDHGDTGDPQRQGAVPLEEQRWMDLDDGVQIAFEKEGDYRQGDAWVIPARTVQGGIEWPADAAGPSAVPPHRAEHHRAPLALVAVDEHGAVRVVRDLRRVFRPLPEGS